MPAGTPLTDVASRMGAIGARDVSGHNNHLYVASAASAQKGARSTTNRGCLPAPSTMPNASMTPLRQAMTDACETSSPIRFCLDRT